MKIVKVGLAMAAGVAVGSIVFLAVLVQVVVHLAPLLALVAVAALALAVARRIHRGPRQREDQLYFHPPIANEPPAQPIGPAMPAAAIGPGEEPYLRWGPAVEPGHPDDLDTDAASDWNRQVPAHGLDWAAARSAASAKKIERQRRQRGSRP